MPINVFIGESQNIVRKGLKLLLENELDVSVVGEADDGYTCLCEVNKLNPNIVIMDIDLKNLDAIKTLRIMREQEFNVKVLLLASDDDSDKIISAVDAGCDGYLLKNCEVFELRNAIFSLYQGNTYIQNSLKELLNASLMMRNSSADKISELTSREIEILRLVAEGLLNKEIGLQLNISERTVKNHVSNIFKKIQVSDRTQAAVFAIKNNLISI